MLLRWACFTTAPAKAGGSRETRMRQNHIPVGIDKGFNVALRTAPRPDSFSATTRSNEDVNLAVTAV
jgi:hypothetical protein